MPAPDNVYWVFSAAAQALAAVVAFLLAGYALVHSMMESRAASDETLVEINDKLSRDYHRALSTLIVVTVVAILADLLAVYLNGSCAPWWVQLPAALSTVVSLVGAVLCVVSIVDPTKYKRAARQMARAQAQEPKGSQLPAEAFLADFDEIRHFLDRLWQSRIGIRPQRGWHAPPVREMVQSLHAAGILTAELTERIGLLSRARNLVAHGGFEVVDSEQAKGARRVKEELRDLLGSA